MPQCCVVPRCSNKKSGYRFPTDPVLRKEWLIAIRRDKFVPTEHSRVCNAHFAETDYEFPKYSIKDNPKPHLIKGAKPSIFAWSRGKSLATSRSERMKNRHRKNQSIEETGSLDSPIPNEAEDTSNFLEVTEDENLQCSEVVIMDLDEEVNSDGKEVECYDKNANSSDEGERGEIKLGNHEGLGTESQNNSEDKEGSCNNKQCSHSMRINDYNRKEKSSELQFYTGFENYDHFMFVFNLLGPAVNKLNYYSEYSSQGGKGVKNLKPEDQLFLTLVKLRRNMSNIELSFRFNVSQAIVTRVFITWLNFLYCQLKEIDIWPSHESLSNLMQLKGEDCHATVIIDCTEVKIVHPKNPVSQQQTFSTYKRCNTIKVLVGISPTGAVTFCSDAYGGSISDRQIFERCGILDKLQPNDIIMADRGFPIQDLVCHKDVKVVTPECVPAKGQLKPDQLKRSKKVSSKRIHVERVIGLAKTFAILKGPLSSTLVPLASRIVFVCFMLANFRANIVM